MDPTDKGAQDPEDDYASSEDEDFNPTEVGAHDDEDVSASSGDEEIPATAAAPKARKSAKKRKQADADQEAELDSGDEATIQEFEKKKRRKKAAAAAAVDDGDSGGEGGLIKTRAQRRAEYAHPVSCTIELRTDTAAQKGRKGRVPQSRQRPCHRRH